MDNHDGYGKMVLREAAGSGFVSDGPTVQIDYGCGSPARIDGTVNCAIAVEIESRVSKQVRGAVLDLIRHSYTKKLLVLLPVHMHNPRATLTQCGCILEKFLKPQDFRVILLTGSATNPQIAEDVITVRKALLELGFSCAA